MTAATHDPATAEADGPVITRPPLPQGYGTLLQQFGRPTPTVEQQVRVLDRTCELLASGWRQDNERDGGLCLVNALSQACVDLHPGDAARAYADVIEYVTDELANRGWFGRPEDWNDAQGRTLDDVLGALAAARAAVTT